MVIIDDLERKHDDLGMEEILGLMDSLSKIDGIKIVIVAAKEQFSSEDAQKFTNYKEKAIDRIYTLTDYAVDAPKEILGEEVWEVISKNVENFKEDFKNLRTFEKANAFIKEVVSVLGEEVFTDKFTKADFYRMCFAIVFFNVEHNNEMQIVINEEVLGEMNEEGEEARRLMTLYGHKKSGLVRYLSDYILKNSLDNPIILGGIFLEIKKWFETGTYSKEDICFDIDGINNYTPRVLNFYSSEQEILNFIKRTRNYLKNLDKNERILHIFSAALNGFAWSEVLGIEYGLSNSEIITLAKDNISKEIDITRPIHENEIRWGFFIEKENKNTKPLIDELNNFIQIEYYNQLLRSIKDTFSTQSFDDYYALRQLQDSVLAIHDEQIRNSILTNLKENDFYFPLPSGTINDSLWNWCGLVNLMIKDIEKNWGVTNLYEEFKTYNYNREDPQNDKMLKYRLDSLFEIIENIRPNRFATGVELY